MMQFVTDGVIKVAGIEPVGWTAPVLRPVMLIHFTSEYDSATELQM